jgi:enoyl reductase-like protein
VPREMSLYDNVRHLPHGIGQIPGESFFLEKTEYVPQDMTLTVTNLKTCVNSIVKVFEDFGFNSKNYDTTPTINYFSCLCKQIKKPDPWVDVIKHHLAACFFALL